jgi:hypothetical protein
MRPRSGPPNKYEVGDDSEEEILPSFGALFLRIKRVHELRPECYHHLLLLVVWRDSR